MSNCGPTLDPLFLEPPAPREQLLQFIQTNIEYDEILRDIQCGRLKSNAASLAQVVETILDVQYDNTKYAGRVFVGGYPISADEAAALALQARWFHIELVLSKTAKLPAVPEDLPTYVLNTLCGSIGTLEAYRFAEKQTAKRRKMP